MRGVVPVSKRWATIRSVEERQRGLSISPLVTSAQTGSERLPGGVFGIVRSKCWNAGHRGYPLSK